MRGVLNVNKPSGISSYDVIRLVKPMLRSRVALGHAGTLDPLASGVLLLLLAEATKVSRFLLGLPKEYVAGVLFGRQTDTDDVTGKALHEQPVAGLTARLVEACLARFRGEVEQVPPAFSALKQNGQPLYRLARRGEEVRPRSRRVTVHELELLDLQPPRATIRCRVSAGTYVRSLARDLGKAVGTGATLETLVRTEVGQFNIREATPPDALGGASLTDRLIPIGAALAWMPHVTVSPAQALRLLQGRVVKYLPTPRGDGFAVAETADRGFLAMVVSRDGELRTERVIYAD